MSDPFSVIEHKLPPVSAADKTAAEQAPEPKPFPSEPRVPEEGVPAQGEQEPFFSSTTRVATVTQKVGDIAAVPYNAVGRLEFSWRGRRWHGSAWIVESLGLITAAHNVYDKDKGERWGGIDPADWSRNIVFRLQYDEGKQAAIYHVKSVYILQGWADSGRTMYDMAACLTVEEVAQGLPIAANLPPEQDSPWISIGYPGKPIPGFPFNGKIMWESTGDFVRGDDRKITIGSQLSRGASGGPWWIRINRQHYVNGLTSVGPASENTSPYFGQGIVNLRTALVEGAVAEEQLSSTVG